MIAHIGYHKTGTTYLQNNVYPYLQNISFIDYQKCDAIFRDLIYKPDTDYRLDNTMAMIAEYSEGQGQLLFSYEGLVGPLFYKRGIGSKMIASRLKQLGFKKIIITVRSQVGLLESAYVQYIQEGGVAKISDFYNPENHIFDWDYCNYFRLINHYIKLFGKENILVLLQEDLKSKPGESIESIISFLDNNIALIENRKQKRSNKSLSRISVQLLRYINHFTYSSHNPTHIISKRISTWKFRYLFQEFLDPLLLSRISGKKSLVPENIYSLIQDYYKESNRELAQLTGLYLSGYKYPF